MKLCGEGISKTGELLKIASDLDIISKKQGWYSYKEMKKLLKVLRMLKYTWQSPEIFDEIDKQVRFLNLAIDGEEVSEQKILNKKDEPKKEEAVNEEVTLET